MNQAAPMGGGSGFNYSDHRFDASVEAVEELLGDLMGIEAAAQAVRSTYIRRQLGGNDDGATTTFPLTLPVRHPFTVYPMLALEPAGEEGSHQTWLNSAFAAGKSGADGAATWMRGFMANYYEVDAQALITGAIQQAALIEEHGTQIDEDLALINVTLGVHWEGDAKDEFLYWCAKANSVPLALLHYATAAQVCAGACGDVIGAIQQTMLQQTEQARTALSTAVAAWREDADQFPFAPGTGWKFKEIGVALQGKIDEYVAMIPVPDVIPGFVVDTVAAATQGKVLSKIPALGPAMKTYQWLTLLESEEKDVAQQPTAAEITQGLKGGLLGLADEGDASLALLADRISLLAAELEAADVLVLPRLPRDPTGSYDA